MGILTRNCPHCGAQKIAFTPFGEYAWKPTGGSTYKCLTAFRCAGCTGGYIIESDIQTNLTPNSAHGDVDKEQYIHIRKEYPEKTERKSPEYLPENIKSFYIQAQTALHHKSFDASSIMSRKCLEAAVKNIDPSSSGTLFSRIEGLYKKGLITEALKDWAHVLREDGNEAAHEETPVSDIHATELLSFSELLLIYLFTLPGMIGEKRKNVKSVSA